MVAVRPLSVCEELRLGQIVGLQGKPEILEDTGVVLAFSSVTVDGNANRLRAFKPTFSVPQLPALLRPTITGTTSSHNYRHYFVPQLPGLLRPTITGTTSEI